MHRFLTRNLQILRSLVLVVSLSVLSISVTNFIHFFYPFQLQIS